MFLTSNDKAKTDFLMLIFGLFTIDGDKKVFNGHDHYLQFYCCTGHIEVVSINF